uniref:FERM C-terminal PH-like domain-containing protein n=1 Tax=Fundulus heteroclitus TaxID=8078 RepID=A0A3Q2P371_FUNHE
MSTPTKHEKTVCVLLPNKNQLDVTVGVSSTGQDVFNRVAELLGIKELRFFGLTVLKDNEHIFLDMEEKLSKYFHKEWRQDSGKGSLKRPFPILLCLKVQFYVENGRLFRYVLNTIFFSLSLSLLHITFFFPFILREVLAANELSYLSCSDAFLTSHHSFLQDKKEERGTALLGLTLRGMQVYQEANNIRQLLYDFPWSNVGRLTFLGKKFEIQPDGLPSARKLVYYTGSSFRSRHLLLHLSSSHQVYLSLQPALKHLRQLEESKEKRYRESYISDDLDLDPPGSEGSPGLSRHSTGSSGIEADARQHSICPEMTSMGEEGPQLEEKCLSLATSHDSSITLDPEEALVDDPYEMFQLADRLEGVSVDFANQSAETQSAGICELSSSNFWKQNSFYSKTWSAFIRAKIDK